MPQVDRARTVQCIAFVDDDISPLHVGNEQQSLDGTPATLRMRLK